MATTRKNVMIYTDGACRGNPGPGGYGVVLLYGSHRKELSAGYRLTTNNRMEILAAISALEALSQPCRVSLHSDSEYLITGACRAEEWKRNGWRLNPPKAKKALNRDLWKRLLNAMKPHEVSFVWVRGHSDEVENNRCDELAVEASKGADLLIDEGFENENPSLRALAEARSEYQPPPGAPKKLTEPGQPCRKCGEPVEKRISQRRRKPNQKYYYEWLLVCPLCNTVYLVDAAKREIES